MAPEATPGNISSFQQLALEGNRCCFVPWCGSCVKSTCVALGILYQNIVGSLSEMYGIGSITFVFTNENAMCLVSRAANMARAQIMGVIWLSATRFRRSYFLCFGGADRMAFASFS